MKRIATEIWPESDDVTFWRESYANRVDRLLRYLQGKNKMAAKKLNLLLSLFFAWLSENVLCSFYTHRYMIVIKAIVLYLTVLLAYTYHFN